MAAWRSGKHILTLFSRQCGGSVLMHDAKLVACRQAAARQTPGCCQLRVPYPATLPYRLSMQADPCRQSKSLSNRPQLDGRHI